MLHPEHDLPSEDPAREHVQAELPARRPAPLRHVRGIRDSRAEQDGAHRPHRHAGTAAGLPPQLRGGTAPAPDGCEVLQVQDPAS